MISTHVAEQLGRTMALHGMNREKANTFVSVFASGLYSNRAHSWFDYFVEEAMRVFDETIRTMDRGER